jgi:sec-independent protein translocase protein TatB
MFPLEQGAFEMLLIGAIALIVVGPKDLPILMRKVAEFRSSFDEMARQSELDELRKEVEALRTGSYAAPISAEIDQHLSDFNPYPTGYPSPPEPTPAPLTTPPSIELASDAVPELAPKKVRAKKLPASAQTPAMASKPGAPRKPKAIPITPAADEAEG